MNPIELAAARRERVTRATFEQTAEQYFQRGLVRNRIAIAPEASDRAFVDRHQLLIQGDPADWVTYAHLAELAEDDHPEMVVMAGAQTGKTVKLILRILRDLIRKPGAWVGAYWPTADLARDTASRLAALLQSNRELYQLLTASGPGGAGKVKQRQGLERMTICGSTGVFLYTGPPEKPAMATTESYPFYAILLDELRKMAPSVVELIEKRTSGQTEYRRFYCSTAGAPGVNIDARFQNGDQRYWHSACSCPDGSVLALTWPNCLEDLRNASAFRRAQVNKAFEAAGMPPLGMVGELAERFTNYPACYVCPACGDVIANPRVGWFEPHNPGAYAHSYQMPQMLSPAQPAARILETVETATDKAEILRSVVARPFISEGDVYLSEADLAGCVDAETRWWVASTGGPRSDPRRVRRVAGVDVQVGYLVLVILGVLGNRVTEVQHIEIIHDPELERNRRSDRHWDVLFLRLVEWEIKILVIDNMPEPSSVARLQQAVISARANGRVMGFCAVYSASYGQMAGTQGRGKLVAWGDDKDDHAERGADATSKTHVVINRTMAHSAALDRWKRRLVRCPDPDALQQRIPLDHRKEPTLTADLKHGDWESYRLCLLFFKHLRSVAFVMAYSSDEARLQGDGKLTMEHVGCDPHFAHAYLYATIAAQKLDPGLIAVESY